MSVARDAGSGLEALYAALDAERHARGLSWAAVGRELGVASSTLRGLGSRSVAEGDGVLHILRWLGSSSLPDVPSSRMLRFDVPRTYTLLDARRRERGMTWAAVASEIGGTTGTALSRMAAGSRIMFPLVARIARWLDVPIARLTRIADR